MKLDGVVVVLAVLGAGFVLAGVGVASQDVGSCPNNVRCSHTFPGTDIPITPTGEAIELAGVMLVLSSLVLYYLRRNAENGRELPDESKGGAQP